MKRISYLLALLCLASFCNAQVTGKKFVFPKKQGIAPRSAVFTYTLITSTETYTDLVNPISLNNGDVWDDPEYVVPIGFPFELNGNPVTELTFLGAGGLLGAPTADPDVLTAVFPFETDLIDRGYEEGNSVSPISYEVVGSPGNRILKIEWKNAGSYYEHFDNGTTDMFINVQLWLFEGTNNIEFHYGPQSIPDEETFYGGETGAYIGVTDLDQFEELVYNPHFLAGSAFKPVFSEAIISINGTPPANFEYALTLTLPLTLAITSVSSTSYCDPNGSATVTATGGVEPYSHLWNTNENTAMITGLAPGIYSVTVTDQSGTSATASVEVTAVVEPMILEVGVMHESGAGANDGTATVTILEGAAPYTIEWSNGETTAEITNLAPGIYTVTVTDDEGCIETATAIINPFGCPALELESGVSNTSCFGTCDGAVAAEVLNGALPIVYEWDNGETGTFIDQLCPGFYTVTATDNNNCIVVATFEVGEPAALVADAGSTDETLEGANDGTAWVVASGGTAPYAYSWNNGGTDSLIINLAPGSYSVIVTDVFNCVAYDTVVVAPGPCAILTATVTDASCFSVCDGSIDLDAGGFISFTWSNGSASPDLNNLCAGDYTITASDGAGCTVIETFTVSEPDELIAQTGSTAESIAGGDGTAWVVPSGGTPPYAYEWSNGSTDSLVTGLIADTYFVTLTDSHGCLDTQAVEVGEFICLIIDENEVQHVFCHDACNGLIFVVPMGGVGPFEYAWSNGDTANITFDLCAGWYSVTVTDLGQGCSTFIDVEIIQPDSFYVTADVVHETDTTQAGIDITIQGGTFPYAYVWFGPNGFLSFNEDLVDIVPGEYILSLFDGHDCSIIDTFEVLDLTTGLPVLPEGQVAIFPNPATDRIYIETKLQGAYTVELFSPIGEYINTWQNVRYIDVSQLAQGLYVIMYKHADGYLIRKIIIP